jgi:dTMP kinase
MNINKINLNKGILIVFEGIDGSGKTTQAQILLDHLLESGYEAVNFREPSLGKWGRKIKEKAAQADSLTPRDEFELFQKDRKENVEKNLTPALRKKKIVVLDRYYFSTIAYQGAKGINPQMIKEANEKFAVPPDLVFIFDIQADKGLERIEDRKNKDRLFEREDYLIKVQKIFKSFGGEGIIHINAAQQIKEISEKIKEITLRYINKYRA